MVFEVSCTHCSSMTVTVVDSVKTDVRRNSLHLLTSFVVSVTQFVALR